MKWKAWFQFAIVEKGKVCVPANCHCSALQLFSLCHRSSLCCRKNLVKRDARGPLGPARVRVNDYHANIRDSNRHNPPRWGRVDRVQDLWRSRDVVIFDSCLRHVSRCPGFVFHLWRFQRVSSRLQDKRQLDQMRCEGRIVSGPYPNRTSADEISLRMIRHPSSRSNSSLTTR